MLPLDPLQPDVQAMWGPGGPGGAAGDEDEEEEEEEEEWASGEEVRLVGCCIHEHCSAFGINRGWRDADCSILLWCTRFGGVEYTHGLSGMRQVEGVLLLLASATRVRRHLISAAPSPQVLTGAAHGSCRGAMLQLYSCCCCSCFLQSAVVAVCRCDAAAMHRLGRLEATPRRSSWPCCCLRPPPGPWTRRWSCAACWPRFSPG